MNENPAAEDWAAGRGEKWRDHLSGLEATLATVDEPLIQALQLDAPGRIADIGCGGGGTTFEIHRRAAPGSVVHGFDISPALLEAARTRRKPEEEGTIAFTLADVATEPPRQPYDRLASRFGVMFYDDPPAAFTNLARWLAPGGRFAFAVWGRPGDNPWMTTLREVMTEFLEVPAPDSEAPGPFRYGDVTVLLSLLERAGFDDLSVERWRGALPIGGGLPAAGAARFALSSFGIAELLDEAEAEVADDVRRALAARFSRHEREGAVRIEACVHILTGARPGARPG